MIRFTNTLDVLNDFGKFLVEEYKDNLILNDAIASGSLYDSITYIIEDRGKSIEVKLSLNEYAKYIENGRKPGKFQPISAIKRWIEIKPVLPRPMSNGKLPTNEQLAFLIARKIGLEGIKPRPILQKSIDDVFEVMREFLEEALAKDIQEEFELILLSVRK